MARKRPKLTSTQSKALRKATTSLDRAYAAARKTLSAAGIERVDDSGLRCLASPPGHCRAFKPPRQGIRCARPGCGHSFARHDVF